MNNADTFTPDDRKRLGKQLDLVRRKMLMSLTWLTLAELEIKTGYPQASISARLRDLRRLGYTVDRRRRSKGTWEYRVSVPERQKKLVFEAA